MYVIELGQLARQQASGPLVSPEAEEPVPGVVWSGLTVPPQAGPPETEEPGDGPRDGVVWSNHRPRVSAVEAGFFRWDLASGEVTLEPGIRRLHGLPADGPATLAELLDRVPEEDAPGLARGHP